MLSKVVPDDITGCWEWTDHRNRDGYGQVKIWIEGKRRTLYAHKASYEEFIGPVPDGLELDHFVCDNPGCINPWHMRPVTHRENCLRSNNGAALNAAKNLCPRNHPYDHVDGEGRRRCRTCERELKRARRA